MKCYVTRCSLLELKALGAPLSGNYTALTALMKLHIVSSPASEMEITTCSWVMRWLKTMPSSMHPED